MYEKFYNITEIHDIVTDSVHWKTFTEIGFKVLYWLFLLFRTQ